MELIFSDQIYLLDKNYNYPKPINEYLRLLSFKSKSTERNYAFHLLHWLNWCEGKELGWDKVKDSDVLDYRNSMGCSNKTINYRMRILVDFYLFLEDEGAIPVTPFIKLIGRRNLVKLPSSTKEIKLVSLEEVGVFLDGLNPRNRLMAEVMFYGGLRRSEVLSLTRTSLKTLEICGKRSKTRQFNLPLELIKRLRDYATDEVIFKLHPSTVNKIFVENSKRTGVKIHPHMLRHLFATHRLAYLEKTKQPGALKRVQMELGHANINTTSVYLHLVETMESVYQDYIADIKRRML